MKALILSAGFGTRLLPHTGRIPKPLFCLAGRPMIDIIISRLVAVGAETIVINTHHLHEMLKDHLSKNRYAVPVICVQEPEILGTGGAIRANAQLLGPDPFIVINCDIDTDIDIKDVYKTHLDNKFPVTLVLHDYRKFNTVTINEQEFITGFNGQAKPESLLAFTGIQVIDVKAALRMPKAGASIDGYKKMINQGEKIKAHIVKNRFWNDVGTPEGFVLSAARCAAPDVFKAAFNLDVPIDSIDFISLSGDGSDRKWHRVGAAGRTMIMAGHSIASDTCTCEADSFVNIGRHLHIRGVAVPQIFSYDRFSGLVFLEDLGDTHLCDMVSGIKNQHGIVGLYKKVIKSAAVMWVAGYKGFDRSWTFQTKEYDKDVIIQRECLYFFSSLINGYLKMEMDPSWFAKEFDYLATKILENRVTGFMHRDFQSANIMIRKGRPFFIDFQAGRAGPIQYDLASLLADPYVNRPGSMLESLEDELLDYATGLLANRISLDSTQFITGYRYSRISRLLQALGAFGFLSDVKKKTRFAAHIQPALGNLLKYLKRLSDQNLSGLCRVVEKAGHVLATTSQH
ncbi:MAG: phosphotransferase [Deltaproteobacteria bacterium]|nr:phosphotransferase [Deltaproteobacteria bacterium]